MKLSIEKVATKDGKDFKEVHELSVKMTRIFGKTKLDLLLKLVEQENTESLIYESIIEKLIKYLKEKYGVTNPCRFLPIPEYVTTLKGSDNPEYTNFKMIITKNVKCSGYLRFQDGTNLDYEHSTVALASLARFHAISYCYQKEKNGDLEVHKKVLENSSLLEATRENIFQMFKKHPEFHLYAHLFLGQEDVVDLQEHVDTFNVLCHGPYFETSLMFKYALEDEEERPCDSIFHNLGNCYRGSIIPDLLIFLFSCVNHNIRKNFLLQFITTVYYDTFKSAVNHINKDIFVFTKIEFFTEVKRLAVSCGLSALEMKLQVQEKLERRKSISSDQETVLATFRDVLKIVNCQDI